MVDEARVGLASAIEALRGELVEAVSSGEGKEFRFELGVVELELQVAVEKKVEGEAGIKFWLVSLGGGGSRSVGDTHTVKVSLTPVREAPDGAGRQSVVVGGERTVRPR